MSYSRYFSPAQVESDQKDVIISQLKAELFELKQNHRNYQEVSTHLTNLEHRYNLLLEEKSRGEKEYKLRNEANQNTIQTLKSDIDTLKSQVGNENYRLNELKSEHYELSDIVENRSREIKRLKEELQILADSNSQINDAKKNVENQIYAARDDKQGLLKELEGLENELSNIENKRKTLDNELGKLQLQKSSLEKDNLAIARDNDDLSKELKGKNDMIKLADQQLKESDRNIQILTNDVKNLEKTLDKYKGEALNNNRALAAEQDRGEELLSHLEMVEKQVGLVDKALQSSYAELNDLKSKQLNLIDTNEEVLELIEANKRHIEVLIGENNEILGELDRFAEQDERCRQTLSRSDKIQDLRHRVDERLRNSKNILQAAVQKGMK